MQSRIAIFSIPALVILWIIQGCAVERIHVPTMATVKGISGHFRVGQIIDLKAGTVLSFEKFIDEIGGTDLIFVGEVHDNPEHHLIQVQLLQALLSCCGPMDMAMEFFQKPQQPIVDRYLRGEITEAVFLKEVHWERGWGFDYQLYRPLMLWAKEKGSRVLAINAPVGIVRKVARYGLKGLSAHERSQLPKEIDLGNEAHRAYVRQAYEQHEHGELKNFEHFYEAQCVWEESMAQNLSDHLMKNGGTLLVFAGNGHIGHKFGIPQRALRRTPVSMVTIMPYPLHGHVSIERDIADYLWLTASYPYRHRNF